MWLKQAEEVRRVAAWGYSKGLLRDKRDVKEALMMGVMINSDSLYLKDYFKIIVADNSCCYHWWLFLWYNSYNADDEDQDNSDVAGYDDDVGDDFVFRLSFIRVHATQWRVAKRLSLTPTAPRQRRLASSRHVKQSLRSQSRLGQGFKMVGDVSWWWWCLICFNELPIFDHRHRLQMRLKK